VRIVGGTTIEVFRHVKDRFGDKVTETSVGTIPDCLLQWSTGMTLNDFKPNDQFQETSALTAVLFAPRNAPIKLEHRDRIMLDGNRYQVASPRAWDHPHPATGHSFSHYAVQVEMVE
jgi:hypothetical protein